MSTRSAGRRTAVATLAGSVVLGASLMFGAASASAAADGSTQQVCADHLALRTVAKSNGPDQGEIYQGEHVLVHSHAANGMLWVHAYGHLNRDGYVDDGHFC